VSDTTQPAASRRALLAGALGVAAAVAVAQPTAAGANPATAGAQSSPGKRTETHGGGLHAHLDGVVHRHPMTVHEMGRQ
jgi:hypothetical protein